MQQSKLWQYEEIPEDRIRELAEAAGISELLAQILLSRGITDTAFIRNFLNPSLDQFHDPFLLPDMDKAAERICGAVNQGEKIIIYGDYDVDGITSTTILSDFLMSIGAYAGYYIPDRLDEGYGLSNGAIDKVREMGAALIITVDCGVTAIDEVEYIKACGMEVIITDHHECKEELPRALAVVCPCRHDSGYPFKELAGVGVAFKLIHALCIRLGLHERHMDYLELVSLGTVADVVPLTDENRVIVKYGIQKLESTKNIGLSTLIEFSGLGNKPLTSGSISFGLAPRINAAGRIGSASRAVQLFLTGDGKEALGIVAQLQEDNRLRQDTEMLILKEVEELIEQQTDPDKEKVLVVAGNGWHHGVIGIVASKVTERYYKPCLLISCEEGIGKGSGRSIEGFDLFKALTCCSTILERFGGHEMAAGLTLKAENINELRRMINEYADRELDPVWLVPRLRIDARISSKNISISGVRELEKLAPFGAGNPEPVFEYDCLKVTDIRTVGNNRHLKAKLESDGCQVDAIGFNFGELAGEYSRDDLLDAVCSVEINVWNSNENVQLNLKDLRINEEVSMEESYYRSFGTCLKTLSSENDQEIYRGSSTDFLNIKIEESIADLGEYFKSGEKTLILVNSLDSLKRLRRKLHKNWPDVKKTCSICYTVHVETNCSSISVVVNPDPDKLNIPGFEHIILYGAWVSDEYLNRLLAALQGGQVVLCADEEKCFSMKDIVPERGDLEAVYKFVKAQSNRSVQAEDMLRLAKRIKAIYKININCFKLSKCIEIFEELGLMKRETDGMGHCLLMVADNGRRKADIGESYTYRKLQALKHSEPCNSLRLSGA